MLHQAAFCAARESAENSCAVRCQDFDETLCLISGPFLAPSPFPLGIALVVLGLALGQRDLDLHAAALVVQVQRHQGEALLLDLADQAPDLVLVHQQLLGAVGLRAAHGSTRCAAR